MKEIKSPVRMGCGIALFGAWSWAWGTWTRSFLLLWLGIGFEMMKAEYDGSQRRGRATY